MKAAVLLCLALAMTASAAAQELAAQAVSGSEPAAARMAAAREMVAACRDREQAAAYFDKLADAQIHEAHAQMQGVSEAQWRDFDRVFRDDLAAKVDEYMTLTVSVDATHFSVEDLKALTDFCHSPLGQRISALRAQIERETFEIRQAWLMNAVMSAGQDAMQKVMPGQHGGNGL